MKTIQEIKDSLDSMYGFDILTPSRLRKYAYARKIFTTLLSNYGHTNEAITSEIGIKHHLIIYNRNTIDTIAKIDMTYYNKCIDELSLDIKKITSLKSLSANPIADDIHEQLQKLSRKDLLYFRNQVFKPFVNELKF